MYSSDEITDITKWLKDACCTKASDVTMVLVRMMSNNEFIAKVVSTFLLYTVPIRATHCKIHAILR